VSVFIRFVCHVVFFAVPSAVPCQKSHFSVLPPVLSCSRETPQWRRCAPLRVFYAPPYNTYPTSCLTQQLHKQPIAVTHYNQITLVSDVQAYNYCIVAFYSLLFPRFLLTFILPHKLPSRKVYYIWPHP